MVSKTLAIAFAFGSAVSAVPALQYRQDPCQDAYKACVAAGTPEVACSCTLTACLGEDNARNREWCASATASLSQPTPTSIPGGCNPAHPGSCPDSYFSTTVAAEPTPTSIPGGCNPAHPGSCPTPAAAQPSAAAPAIKAALVADPVPVAGKKWTITNLTRTCTANTACTYKFGVQANGKTEQCSITRSPGSNANTESWSNQACAAGSKKAISWGYTTTPAPAYAVITVVEGKELAWFGVSNVNGNNGGKYGNLGPEQVYTYN